MKSLPIKMAREAIRTTVRKEPGIYEISTKSGELLKVGISVNVHDRLLAHAASRESGLAKINPALPVIPTDIKSKKSILAKHLYFDEARSKSSGYDLKTEEGRRTYLENECTVTVEYTSDRAMAREMERIRENQGGYSYQKIVEVRPAK